MIPNAIGTGNGRDDVADMTAPGNGPAEPTTSNPARISGRDDLVSESADAAGLRVAFLAHGGELYGYARRSLGDPRAAEDVVQDAFVRVVQNAGDFKHEARFTTWVYTIVRNLCIDHLRKRALREGERLYGRRPKKFARRVRRTYARTRV